MFRDALCPACVVDGCVVDFVGIFHEMMMGQSCFSSVGVDGVYLAVHVYLLFEVGTGIGSLTTVFSVMHGSPSSGCWVHYDIMVSVVSFFFPFSLGGSVSCTHGIIFIFGSMDIGNSPYNIVDQNNAVDQNTTVYLCNIHETDDIILYGILKLEEELL